MKRISVIIPAKDRINLLVLALESVYKQVLPKNTKLEVILVDDLSTPSLKSQLKSTFPNLKIVRNTTKLHGPGPARNIGLAHSSGDCVAFLDSDDMWENTFLRKSIKSLEESNTYDATLCLSRPVFSKETNLKEKLVLSALHFTKDVVLYICHLFNGGVLPKSGFYLTHVSHMVCRKESIGKIKFGTFTGGEDWLFFANVLRSHNVTIIPKRLVKYYYSGSSVTHDDQYLHSREEKYHKMIIKLPKESRSGILYFFFKKYIFLTRYLFS